jgi:hypothetical protein
MWLTATLGAMNGGSPARSVPGGRGLSAAQLVARHKKVPQVDHAGVRREADEFFGTEDRVDQGDPWERARG